MAGDKSNRLAVMRRMAKLAELGLTETIMTIPPDDFYMSDMGERSAGHYTASLRSSGIIQRAGHGALGRTIWKRGPVWSKYRDEIVRRQGGAFDADI